MGASGTGARAATGFPRTTAHIGKPSWQEIACVIDAPAELFVPTDGKLCAFGSTLSRRSRAARGSSPEWSRRCTSDPELLASATLGEELAALLNTEAGVRGVTSGKLRAEMKAIGNVSALGGKSLDASDLKITAGWGHGGKDGVTMPGKGKLVERDYTDAERQAITEGAQALGLTLEEALAQLGETTCDVYLNENAYWRNVPSRVWEYTIGGYQVMKKWLSYREAKLLGRPITPEEAHYVRDMARRIAGICLLQPKLDGNYAAVKANAYVWGERAAAPNTETAKQ
jgi:hypothetical protein